jgi:hypothetical protein
VQICLFLAELNRNLPAPVAELLEKIRIGPVSQS